MIQLKNTDCMENMVDIEDESVDLVILDPNYQDWDKLCEQGLICQAVRVLKPTGNIICFTKQPFDFELRKEVDYMFRREFSWTFDNGGAWVSNRMPLVSFQKIYWCTPSKDFYFNPHTGLKYSDATKAFKRKNKVFGGYEGEGRDFTPSEEGCWMRDHYHYNKPMCGKIPAKPLELIEIFVRCLSKEGGTVLDPFMGRGTTGMACKRNKRNFIGYEMDKETFDVAKRYIEQPVQLSLF